MARAAFILLALLSAASASTARAQSPPPMRQTTIFGIVATPGATQIDPKLKPIEQQLKKLLPNHGFKLIGVENKRIGVNESMHYALGDSGFAVDVQLVDWLDADSKVAIRFKLDRSGENELSTLVRTPPNQLFFCDRALPNSERLIIGVGAR